MTFTYYVLAKLKSNSIIDRKDAIPFLTKTLESIGADLEIDLLELGELRD